MLDNYCDALSDEAQLKIAVRLSRLTLPIWYDYFEKYPADLGKINLLIADSRSVHGGAKEIDIHFLSRTLDKIERSYTEARQQSTMSPVPIMKSDATLSPMLATIIQPLTNTEWDHILNESVRLTYTSVFNILAWILYRRYTDSNETHIYVAINQSIDALTRDVKMTTEEVNTLLYEYKHEYRSESENDDWENARPVGRNESLEKDDVYRLIIGEQVNGDRCGTVLAKEVLRQMREEGKIYSDSLAEYLTGTATSHYWDKSEGKFYYQEVDVIVGSFSNTYPLTDMEMLQFISRQRLGSLRENGFEV